MQKADYPATCRGLLEGARAMQASGASQGAIVNWVQRVAAYHSVRVRYDLYAAAAAPIAAPEAVAMAAAEPAVAAVAEPAAVAVAAAVAAVAAVAVEPVAAVAEPAVAVAAEPVAAADADSASSDGSTAASSDGSAARRRGKSVMPRIVRATDGTLRFDIASLFEMPAEPGGRNVRGGKVHDERLLAALVAPEAPAHPHFSEALVGRLVLSAIRSPGEGRAPLYYESNGLVIDARTWRVLAVQPRAFNLRPKPALVDAALAAGEYDVVPVDDGTIVTLYYWENPREGGVWSIASSNGYDVSTLYWMGGLTYAEVIWDLANRLYPEWRDATGMSLVPTAQGGKRLAFTALDRGRCYSVGFRHWNFHPVRADPERMWQVQCVDTLAMRVTYGAAIPGLPGQRVVASPPQSLAAFAAEASDALEAGLAAIAAGSPAGLPNGRFNYGYILRSRRPALTREVSDILVETPLLAAVRRMLYERPPATLRNVLSARNRFEYCATRAFLTAGARSMFLALCPHWRPQLAKLEAFVDSVTHLILHGLQVRSGATRRPRGAIGAIARALQAQLTRGGPGARLNPLNPQTESIVRDYVLNPAYAVLYMRAAGLPTAKAAAAPTASAPAEPRPAEAT